MRNFTSHFIWFWYVVFAVFVIFIVLLYLVLKICLGPLLSNDTFIICMLTIVVVFLTGFTTKVITTPQIKFRVYDEQNYSQDISYVPCEMQNKHGLPVNVKIIARIVDNGFKNPTDSINKIYSGKESFILNAGGSFRDSLIEFPNVRIDNYHRLLVKIEVENIFLISKLYYAWYWRQIGTSGVYKLVLDLIRKKSTDTDLKKVKNAFRNCDC